MTIANAVAAPRTKGPQSPEAKERVRRNALKHGLRAETLVSDEDRDAVAAKVALWTEQLAPANDIERTLVERAATAAVRLKRCARAEQAALEESAARAARVWEARARARVRKLGGRLHEDPFAVVEELESSAFGIDWLINRWSELRGALELRQGKDWNFASIRQMAALLRLDIRVGHDAMVADPSARSLWRCGLSALGYFADLPYLYRIYGGTPDGDPQGLQDGPEAFKLLPPKESARQALRVVIAREIARLEELREEAYESVEAPARSEAIERGLVDTSEEASRRLRYEQVHERTMHRSLNDLSRRQKERLKGQDSAPGASLWGGGVIEPAPAPNNTAIAPESAPVLDDKPDPTEDLQPESSSEPEPEAARTDPFASLSPADAAFGRQMLEMVRESRNAPDDEDEDEIEDEEDIEDDDLD